MALPNYLEHLRESSELFHSEQVGAVLALANNQDSYLMPEILYTFPLEIRLYYRFKSLFVYCSFRVQILQGIVTWFKYFM